MFRLKLIGTGCGPIQLDCFTFVLLTTVGTKDVNQGGWQRGLEPSLHDRPSKENLAE